MKEVWFNILWGGVGIATFVTLYLLMIVVAAVVSYKQQQQQPGE